MNTGTSWRNGWAKWIWEGEVLPRGYGIAYRDMTTDTLVVYPVPINWVVRASRFIRWKLKVPRLGWEREKAAIWGAGYVKGRMEGVNDLLLDLPQAVEQEVRKQRRKADHRRRSTLNGWVAAARELLRDAPGPRATADYRDAWELRRRDLLERLNKLQPGLQEAAERAEVLGDDPALYVGPALPTISLEGTEPQTEEKPA